MLTLRPFTQTDTLVLRAAAYPDMTAEQAEALVTEWDQGQYNGRDFTMLGVWLDGTLVGMISLYRHTAEAVSIGPEIFPAYRRKGYGGEAMKLALDLARQKGYKMIFQQIRADNIASIALHEALGFGTSGASFTNAKGNSVLIYLKSLF